MEAFNFLGDPANISGVNDKRTTLQPPKPPPPPPDNTDAEARARAQREQDEKRKKGRKSTVLTGNEGVASEPVAVKTLVGS